MLMTNLSRTLVRLCVLVRCILLLPSPCVSAVAAAAPVTGVLWVIITLYARRRKSGLFRWA